MDPSSALPNDINALLTRFMDETSSSHLQLNQQRLFEDIQKDATAQPVPIETIQTFKQSLYWESKMKDRYRLKGRKRYLAYRKYINFSPSSMLAADLYFIRNLGEGSSRKKSATIFLMMDLFSRFAQGLNAE